MNREVKTHKWSVNLKKTSQGASDERCHAVFVSKYCIRRCQSPSVSMKCIAIKTDSTWFIFKYYKLGLCALAFRVYVSCFSFSFEVEHLPPHVFICVMQCHIQKLNMNKLSPKNTVGWKSNCTVFYAMIFVSTYS